MEQQLKIITFNDTQNPTLLSSDRGEVQLLQDCYFSKEGIVRERPSIYEAGLKISSYAYKINFLTCYKNNILAFITDSLGRHQLYHIDADRFFDFFRGVSRSLNWEIVKKPNSVEPDLYDYPFPKKAVEYNYNLLITNILKSRKVLKYDGRYVEELEIKYKDQIIYPTHLLVFLNSLFLVNSIIENNKIYWTLPVSFEIGEDNWIIVGDEKPITAMIIYQNRFLVFKEDKIYEIIGLHTGLPQAVVEVAKIGSPYGIVSNYQNKYLIFFANDGDLYKLEGNNLMNISKNTISKYLKSQYYPIREKRYDERWVKFWETGRNTGNIGGVNFVEEINLINIKHIEGMNAVRNNHNYNRETRFIYNGLITPSVKTDNRGKYALLYKPGINVRISKIIVSFCKIKRVNNQDILEPIRFIKIYQEENWKYIGQAEMYEYIDYGDYLKVTYKVKEDNWDGFPLLEKNKEYYFVFEVNLNENFQVRYYRELSIFEPSISLCKEIAPNEWEVIREWEENEYKYAVIDVSFYTTPYLKESIIYGSLQLLPGTTFFDNWYFIKILSDNVCSLSLRFYIDEHKEIGTEQLEILLDQQETKIYLYVPNFYTLIDFKISLYAWGENLENPSHLWGIQITWFPSLNIQKEVLPKIISGKEATYLFCYSQNWVEAIDKGNNDEIIKIREKERFPKTILRIDEYLNFSIFNFLNLWSRNDYLYKFIFYDPVIIKDFIFLPQNRSYTSTDFLRDNTILFSEEHRTLMRLETSFKKIPYKIYILSKGFTSPYWQRIKKLLFNLLISSHSLYSLKVALIPLRKEEDFSKKWGEWIDSKDEKLAFYYELKDFSSEDVYLKEIFKKTDFKTYECLADIIFKDFCIALKTNSPFLKLYPVVLIDYDIIPTTLTGDKNIDNLIKIERGNL